MLRKEDCILFSGGAPGDEAAFGEEAEKHGVEEVSQHAELNSAVEKLSGENLALQEEIHNLKSDSPTIEREARKIGMSRPNEKVLVPTN